MIAEAFMGPPAPPSFRNHPPPVITVIKRVIIHPIIRDHVQLLIPESRRATGSGAGGKSGLLPESRLGDRVRRGGKSGLLPESRRGDRVRRGGIEQPGDPCGT
jgi:hypothetical protein